MLETGHPLVEKVTWEALPATEPACNPALLKSDFPYGAALEKTDLAEPSVLVKIYCKEQYFFNIEPGKAKDLNFTYKVRLK